MIEELKYLPLKDIEKDRLGFEGKSQEIATFINNFSPKLPYSLSINGSWGAGKSTMLNFIETKLDKGKCKVIRFNPWMITEKEDLIKSLFEEIYYAMGEGDFQNAKNTFFKYARKLIPSATKALTFAGAYMHGIAPAAATTASTIAGDTSQVVSDALFDEKPLSKRKEDLNTLLNQTLREDGQKIVIMIDELDRLFPDEVITVFQMIKSNLDLPGLFFVVAMDGEVVFDALKAKGVSKPDYYLQKIFQRSYLINTKYQIKTLSENFIMKYLDHDIKSHRELHEALLAYFYLEDHVFIFAPGNSASFYDISLSDDYTKSNDTDIETVGDSYADVLNILTSELNIHNPRAFLRFAEILIEKWDRYYNYIFEKEKEIKHFIYISFLIFISHYACPDYTETHYLMKRKRKDDDRPLFIQEVGKHIQYLMPSFTYKAENGSLYEMHCDYPMKLAIEYLNQFPDLKRQ
ncbi:KAP family P-loop NTPase fold protein [Bacillus cereus]|uniref:KAP family P-loop NTPase fold protein n=1 Tax=Bacillus cereus TaxID=1396 RepID=UPI0025A18D58|nr:P-loop NTPase fold protein [Bacillus cereus]MDM5460012.1 P-loop NTPase fold protein [Bacillus cereus]